MTYTKKHLQKGVTLVEMLVTISILAILAFVFVVNFQSAITRARYVKARDEIRAIKDAMYFMKQDTGKWPFGCIPSRDSTATYNAPSGGDQELDLNNPQSGLFKVPSISAIPPVITYEDGTSKAIDSNTANACVWTAVDIAKWKGPYIGSDKLLDPWGGSYVFDRDNPPTLPTFTIYSWGFQQPPDCWGTNPESGTAGFGSPGILRQPINSLEFLPYEIEKAPYTRSIPGYC